MVAEYAVANEGRAIPNAVRRLANPRSIRGSRQNRAIAVSSVVFIDKNSMAAKNPLKTAIMAAGV